MVAVAIGGTTWGVSAPTTASGYTVRADEQTPSVDDAKSDLDRARTKFESAQETESAAQRRAEKASQASVDAAATARRAAAQAERARAESKDASASSENAREELGRLAAHAYANNAGLGRLAELGAAMNPDDFQDRSTSLSELMRVQDTMVLQAAESRADARNAASRAEGQASAAAEASADAKDLADEAEAALDEAADAAEQAEQALAEVKQVYAAAQRAEEEREAAEEAPDRNSREDDDDDQTEEPPPQSNGEFVMPSTGPITSPYGMRVHPLTGVYKLHSGTDFGASCGAGAHAASGGTVESAGYAGAYGNQVVIDHGTINGLDVSTTYNHLSGFSVSAGQSVSAGEQIGLVGTTGSSTGCHLHFEVLVNGEFTDPMGWLS